jgi:hypothetical protein
LNGGIHALVLDGTIDIDLVRIAEKLGVQHIVATSTKVRDAPKVNLVTDDKLN